LSLKYVEVARRRGGRDGGREGGYLVSIPVTGRVGCDVKQRRNSTTTELRSEPNTCCLCLISPCCDTIQTLLSTAYLQRPLTPRIAPEFSYAGYLLCDSLHKINKERSFKDVFILLTCHSVRTNLLVVTGKDVF
jgi:hypothetical protein